MVTLWTDAWIRVHAWGERKRDEAQCMITAQEETRLDSEAEWRHTLGGDQQGAPRYVEGSNTSCFCLEMSCASFRDRYTSS